MQQRASSGFTLWELMVVVALVVVLFVTALENLLPLRGEAEKAALLATIGSLRSATGLEASRRAIVGAEALRAMDGADPMAWLAAKPERYVGDVERSHDVPRGGWGYLAGEGVLFYRIRYPEYFRGGSGEPAGLRFRVDVTFAGTRVSGIRLAELDHGQWRTGGAENAHLLEQGDEPRGVMQDHGANAP